MAELDERLASILEKVTEEDTQIDAIVALVEQLKVQVGEIVAGSITAQQRAQLDEIFTKVADNPDRLRAAIAANTSEPIEPETPEG